MQLCEQEFVRRLTVIQDPAQEAIEFRRSRFAALRAVAELRESDFTWPAPVDVLRRGFKFYWDARYLRNLVMKSDRQVFFATADEKIAGLFAHKFGFLGEEFRTIELTRT